MFLTCWRGLTRAARLAAPTLRVIALTYTGLSGMLALLVVVGVAITPVAPGLQQVTQPAREAVGSLVQPTGLAVASLLGTQTGSGLPVAAPLAVVVPLIALVETLPAPADGSDREVAAVDDATTDTSAGNAASDAPVETGPPVLVVVSKPLLSQAAPVASAIEDEPVAENDEAGIDESPPTQLGAPDALVAEPTAAPPGLQIASEEAPRPLPSVAPVVPLTQAQIKASLDLANQTAIDAARSAQVRARADANAANAAAQATAVSSALVAAQPNDPTPAPNVNPTAQTANQAAIDAARASLASDRAQANAANQAAQDAVRAAQPKKS